MEAKVGAIVGGVSLGVLGLVAAGVLTKKHCEGGVCLARKRLDGKVAIVTGSNTGIGLETAAELARRGCTVIMASRNMARLTEAKKTILERYSTEEGLNLNVANSQIKEDLTVVKSDQLILMELDLSSISSVIKFVKSFTESYQKLNLLICNAGVMMCPYSKTEDGFELQVGTNHMGHFLLTELLIPLVKSSKGRIIMVSSMAHYRGTMDVGKLFATESEYNSRHVYSNSKLYNVMYAKHLSNRVGHDGPLVMSLHPGVIRTELGRHLSPFLRGILFSLGYIFMKNPWQGAQTTLHCALANDEDLVQGGYYSDCKIKTPNPIVENKELVEALATKSYNLISLTEAGTNIFKRKE